MANNYRHPNGNVVIRDRNGNVVHDDADPQRLGPIVGGPSSAPFNAGMGYGSPAARGVPGANLSYELDIARRRAEGAERRLKEIASQPTIVGAVVELRGDTMVVGLGPGAVFELVKLEGAHTGDRVLLARDTLQAVSFETPASAETPSGAVTIVDKVGDFHVEAKLGGESRTFRCMLHEPPKVGDRVVLDPSMSYVAGNLGAPPSPLAYTPGIKVEWGDIGGQEEAKDALRDAIEIPAQHPGLFSGYGKKPSKGVLLHGSPGTGKTMLAKAGATALARIAGEELASTAFVYVKGPELLSGWIGATERAIRDVFAGARKHRETHAYPCVVFIDECEALLGRRESGPNLSFASTVVPQFLAEMDGMDESAALFILATNRIDMIDPAVLRDGRVDRRVYVGRPGKEDVAKIAEIKLRDVPRHPSRPGRDSTDPSRPGRDSTDSDLAERIADEMWKDERIVFANVLNTPSGPREVTLYLRDLASGALVAGIIDQATNLALRRDAAAGKKKPGGLRAEDIEGAIDRKVGELARQDHREAINELLTKMSDPLRPGRSSTDPSSPSPR